MMFKFFRTLIKPKPLITQTKLNAIQKAFADIKELQKSNHIDDLKKALYMIDEIEKKYPVCFDTARYYRGKVVSSLVNKKEFYENEVRMLSV